MKQRIALALIGALVAAITTGCNTMYGQQEIGAEAALPWESVSPESQGIEPEDVTRMVEHIEQNDLSIDSVIIYKNGTIPVELYFDPYNKDVSHNMKSTSKGVISALVGIALQEGFIESLDERVLSYFPEYEADDEEELEITIRDLLTMSAGLQWNENDLNSMYTFFVSKRIAKRVLNQPLVDEPGSRFNYSTGLTHLLSVIISRATDMSTQQFAEEYLFEPLDIHNV
jgi:CubicO group peptidase (beta-lactamase class C family)